MIKLGRLGIYFHDGKEMTYFNFQIGAGAFAVLSITILGYGVTIDFQIHEPYGYEE